MLQAAGCVFCPGRFARCSLLCAGQGEGMFRTPGGEYAFMNGRFMDKQMLDRDDNGLQFFLTFLSEEREHATGKEHVNSSFRGKITSLKVEMRRGPSKNVAPRSWKSKWWVSGAGGK